MTTPDDISRAMDAVFTALLDGEWDIHPDTALTAVEARYEELRSLAAQIDPNLWPRGVSTLLWKPADHDRPSADPPPNIILLPD